MHTLIPAIILLFVSHGLVAGTCSQQLKVREIHLTEQRIEVETKKEGVTFGKIMECLHANSENLGDLKFKKPSKKEAAVSFGIGQRLTISRGEYEPFFWTAAYQHAFENLSDAQDDVDFSLVSHHFSLTRKNPLKRSLFLDVTGGIVFTRAHLSEPDTQYDSANDLAFTGGARLWYQLPKSHEIYVSTHLDRFYKFGNEGDLFVYRAHFNLGWEGQVLPGFSIGGYGGFNTLKVGGPAEEFGGLLKFTYYNLSLSYRPQYERVDLKNDDVKGFRHAFSFLAQF